MTVLNNCGFWKTHEPYDCGDKASHLHITSELAIAFVALKYMPSVAKTVPPEQWASTSPNRPFAYRTPDGAEWNQTVHDIWHIYQWTGFGHHECLTCHERYENSRALGFHEARLLVERADYKAAEKTLASLWRGG